MSQVKEIRIQSKVDTKAHWEEYNPILLDREVGYEKETGRYKIGNGINLWKDLPYGNEEYINTHFESIESQLEDKADKIHEHSAKDVYMDQNTTIDDKIKDIDAYLLNTADANWVGAIESQVLDKADKATTLSGYGITDAYTKNDINVTLDNYATYDYLIDYHYNRSEMDAILDSYATHSQLDSYATQDYVNQNTLKCGTKTLSLFSDKWDQGTREYLDTIVFLPSGETGVKAAMINISPWATREQRAVCRDSLIEVIDFDSYEGTLRLVADGTIPTINIPIVITYFYVPQE